MTKKGVSKEDLKRLMKKMKTDGSINHPLAKYNSLGNLICTVCNCQIKSDRLWNPHLMSRSHKENVARPPQNPSQLQSNISSKRKGADTESVIASKKHKDSFSGSLQERTQQKPKSILKNAIPLAGYSSSDEEASDDETLAAAAAGANNSAVSHSQALPADFFDSGSAVRDGEDGEEEMDQKPAEELPEGFFDDPKADAKARNVEYVDKEEAEWDKFQSEMKQETQISEQIEADDDFANTEDRHLEEIDEQLAQWGRVNEMVQQKTELMKQKMETTEDGEDSSSDQEDPDFDEFLDWRSKKIIKS